jgi:hypothetical protein
MGCRQNPVERRLRRGSYSVSMGGNEDLRAMGWAWSGRQIPITIQIGQMTGIP